MNEDWASEVLGGGSYVTVTPDMVPIWDVLLFLEKRSVGNSPCDPVERTFVSAFFSFDMRA